MVSFSVLKERSRTQLKGHWGTAIFVVFLTALAFIIAESFLESETTSSFFLFLLLELFLAAPLYVGKIKYFMDLALGKDPKISEISFGYKNLSKSIFLGVILFIGYIALELVFLLFGSIIVESISGNVFSLILGIILVLGLFVLFYYIVILFSMSYYVFCENPDVPIISCIKRGVNLMKGHVIGFLLLGLSFLGWWILPLIIGCFFMILSGLSMILETLFLIVSFITLILIIPYILWLYTYMEMTYINFYLELNNFVIE